MLTERKREILKEVVLKFIDTGEPVSSQNIVANTNLGLSSATIRKEMAELEKLGYLSHPYASAGRIPSDKGYRFFVDNYINKNLSLNSKSSNEVLLSSKKDISKEINKDMEFEVILKKSSEQLAKMTSYLSMIVAPTIYNSKFRHLEVIELGRGIFLLVLIIDTGRVFKRNLFFEGNYNSLDLQSAANILNLNFKNKNLSEVVNLNLKIPDFDSYLIPVIKKIIDTIKKIIDEALVYNNVYIHGASSILNLPDFLDIKKVHEVIKLIENEYMLVDLLLNISEDDSFIIKIGSEICDEGASDLSLVASRYKIYNQSTGTIGVLGPKRMNYFKVVQVIRAFIENFKEIFS